MKILHPNTKDYLPLDKLTPYYLNGYYSIIADNEKDKLNYFLESYTDYKKSSPQDVIDPSLYKTLPFSCSTPIWKERQKDIKIINELIKNQSGLEILDVGCWNGWLCHYLAKKGHKLTGTSLFTNEIDGLSSKKFYDTEFLSLQLHLNQIYRIKSKFDIIIFNRNWAFAQNPEVLLNSAKSILKTKGKIIITGLSFYKQTSFIQQEFEEKNKTFLKKYSIPLFYEKSKGFLGFNDKMILKKNGINLKPYHLLKAILKFILQRSPIILYGIFENNYTQPHKRFNIW